MRTSGFSLLSIAISLSGVKALNDIYFGTVAGAPCTGITPDLYAYTASQDICEGTWIGPSGYGWYSVCHYNLTIDGNSGITFTGCDPAEQGNGKPTGVSQNGVPELSCHSIDAIQELCLTDDCTSEPGTGNNIEVSILCS